ncbi:MAG: MBL fold metallo-hydrolase [Bacteroidales bacterium]|nr:MBL fold metallo-hydrolase [Bacteroidales bacterium]
MNIKRFTFNPLGEQTRVFWNEAHSAVVADPSFCTRVEREEFYNWLKDNDITLKAILLTHAHFDHIMGVQELHDQMGIPVYMNPVDTSVYIMTDMYSGKAGLPVIRHDWEITPVADGQIISIGGMNWEVLETPGHTPGSVCYLERAEGVLLSGDTLFAGAIGRTDFAGSDYDKEIVSIMEKLIWLDAGIRVLPGHGADTTIGYERANNPFLEPFNEREELDFRESDPQ